jgi:WD40 repeat protein
VEVLGWPDMRRQRLLKGHTSSVMSVALDRQQRYVATGGVDAVACLWDRRDFICQRTFYAMDYPIRCLRWMCVLCVCVWGTSPVW